MLGIGQKLREIEIATIIDALILTNGNVSASALKLKMGRTALQEKLKQYQIRRDDLAGEFKSIDKVVQEILDFHQDARMKVNKVDDPKTAGQVLQNRSEYIKLSSDHRTTYDRLTKNSFIAIKKFEDEKGLRGVWLDIGGDLAMFPSTSNSKLIRSRGRNRAKLIKNPKHQLRLAATKNIYVTELVKMGEPLPSFGSEATHLTILLSTSGRRHDSHNYTKPICDWLVDVGLIDDDSNCEAQAYKKGDKTQTCFEIPASTTIILQRRDTTTDLTREYLDAKFQRCIASHPDANNRDKGDTRGALMGGGDHTGDIRLYSTRGEQDG